MKITSLLCISLFALTLSSCVVERPRHVVVVEERPVRVLPAYAQVVVIRGERCWVHNGVYYRRHSSGGYIVFRP